MKTLNKKLGVVFTVCFILILAACTSNTSNTSNNKGANRDDKIQVVTTIAQIGEPLSVIGGDRLVVKSLMGPSVDPHLYNATHGDIKTMEEANIVFYNGLNLEINMVKIFDQIGKSKPTLALGDSIPKERLIVDENGDIDPHIWFDLDLWQQGLDAAVEKLKEYSPEDADYFENNKKEYFAKMDEVKKETEKLAQIPDNKRVLVTAHDAFGYFGRMHNLEVVGLQGLSTDGEIGVSDIQETIDIIIEYQIPAVFIESSINENSIRAVIEGAASAGFEVALGGELFSDAMGVAGTEEGTYLGMYRHNVDTIYNALNESGE